MTTRTGPVKTAEPFAARPRRLGVAAIAFMIVAASAPLTVIAGGATTAFSVTHVLGVPAGYLVLAACLAVFAVGYTAMSRHVTNAGAFYAYVAQGLGRPVGVGASVLALISYNCMQIGIYGMFGFQVSAFVEATAGWSIPWWAPAALGIAAVAWMGMHAIDLSAKVLGILVAGEFLVVAVFDVVALGHPAEHEVTAVAIEPSSLFVGGVGAVLAFGIAAFMGFESAAIYSEEARDPRRTIGRATFLAVGVIGAFYTLSAWALELAVGPGRIADPDGISAADAGPPLFFGFVARYLGTAWVDVMSILFITSLFAALVAFHNAAARYFFSLGRDGVLPSFLGKVRARHGIPWAGSVTQTTAAAVVVAAFAVAGEGSQHGELYPVVTLFSWLTNDGALGLVLLMVLVSVAVIGYFRTRPGQAGPWAARIAPAVSVCALGAVFGFILANFNVLLGQAEPTATSFLLPAAVIVPGVAGTAWALWLRARKAAVYQQIGRGAEAPATTDDRPVPGPDRSRVPAVAGTDQGGRA